jgi:hypothetical protein
MIEKPGKDLIKLNFIQYRFFGWDKIRPALDQRLLVEN